MKKLDKKIDEHLIPKHWFCPCCRSERVSFMYGKLSRTKAERMSPFVIHKNDEFECQECNYNNYAEEVAKEISKMEITTVCPRCRGVGFITISSRG